MMDVNKAKWIRVQIIALTWLIMSEVMSEDEELEELLRIAGTVWMTVGGSIGILCADTRSIRAPRCDNATSRTTQWYEKSRAKKRSRRWFKKHCRCTPETFDFIVSETEILQTPQSRVQTESSRCRNTQLSQYGGLRDIGRLFRDV